jgi:hypothetical protein
MLGLIKYYLKVIKYNNYKLPISLKYHLKIYQRWQEQIKSDKKPHELELPWISIMAFDYIDTFLNKRSKNDVKIFEYGSGGSSYYFQKLCHSLVSIEHDKKWFSILQKKPSYNLNNWNYKLIEPECHNLSVLDCSNPDYFTSCFIGYEYCSFKKYVIEIEKYPDEYFDLILIDGRSRVSCLKYSRNKLKKGGLLILDNADRSRYFKFPIIDKNDFKLVLDHTGALICSNSFVQTNIYVKI